MKHFQIEFIGLSCNIFTRVVVVYSKPELCKKKIVMRNVHAYIRCTRGNGSQRKFSLCFSFLLN